jgi:hypothetical protein
MGLGVLGIEPFPELGWQGDLSWSFLREEIGHNAFHERHRN